MDEDDERWDDEGDDAWSEWEQAENDVKDMPEGPTSIAEAEDEADDVVEVEEPGEDDEPAPAPASVHPPSYPEPPCTVIVGQGDCLLSLAARYRMSAQTIWAAGENAALRAKRKHMNQLVPGDALHIPERVDAVVTVAADQRHRFRVESPPDCEITIRLLARGEPRAGLPYTLTVERLRFEGTTAGDGSLRHRVPRSARSGELVLHAEEGDRRFPVRLGHLDPIDEVTGLQARLNHLGLGCGALDGWAGPRTRRALRVFQRTNGLAPTGEPDAPTLAALEEAHRS